MCVCVRCLVVLVSQVGPTQSSRARSPAVATPVAVSAESVTGAVVRKRSVAQVEVDRRFVTLDEAKKLVQGLQLRCMSQFKKLTARERPPGVPRCVLVLQRLSFKALCRTHFSGFGARLRMCVGACSSADHSERRLLNSPH